MGKTPLKGEPKIYSGSMPAIFIMSR
jgi:hypothetical protein